MDEYPSMVATAAAPGAAAAGGFRAGPRRGRAGSGEQPSARAAPRLPRGNVRRMRVPAPEHAHVAPPPYGGAGAHVA